MKKWLLGFLSFAVLMLPVSSRAEEEENGQVPVLVMEEMVVTAGRIEEKKRDVTSHVVVISEEEIKQSTAKNLSDLMADKAIGHIHKYTETSSAVAIRGFRSSGFNDDLTSKVLILLDGRRVGTGNASTIMTDNIEKIEIIRGPASVQYGSSAMGGVVNVITKQGKEKISVFAQGSLGSFGYESFGAGFAGKEGNVDFSGSFTRSTMDDYTIGDNGVKYHNTGYDSKDNYSINIGYEFLPGNRIGVIHTGYNLDEAGEPDQLIANDLDNYNNQDNVSTDFIYDGKSSNGKFFWKARYFFGKNEYDLNDEPYDATGFGFWDSDYKSEVDIQGAQAQFSIHVDESVLTAGVDWMNYELDSDPWPPEKAEYDDMAYFILGKTKLFNKLIFTGGLRFDEYDVEVKKQQGKDEKTDNTSFNAGAAYLFTDNLKVRLNYGEGFLMPTPQQLASDYNFWGQQFTGNPDLDPEESQTYEGGLDFSWEALDTSITYFYTDYKKMITTDILADGTNIWINIGKAEIEGAEASIGYDFGYLFDLNYIIRPYASVVYLTKYKDKDTDKDLKYMSDVTASYGIEVRDFNGFTANLNFAYVGEQDIDYYDPNMFTSSEMEKGGFTVANLVVTKKLVDTHKYGSVSLRGEIKNLTDKKYAYVEGYPMAGRSFLLGLRYDY